MQQHNRTERLQAWNNRLQNLPRKILIIAVVLLSVLVTLQLLPYVGPFVVALVMSLLIAPPVRLLSRGKYRLPRSVATLLCMALVYGLLIFLIVLVTGRALVEMKELAMVLPGRVARWVSGLNNTLDEGFVWLDTRVDILSEQELATLREYVSQMGRSLISGASQLANVVARGALNTAISVPQILLFIVLSIVGTFYMVTDRERILSYLKRLLPDKINALLGTMKQGLFRAVLGQLKAQIFLTIMMLIELLVGFSIMRIPYALLLAFLISLLDALPVLGSGLFLIPWSLVGFVTGNMFIGIGMLLLYGITVVMRQLIEPCVVGAQLGLYPLATMMSMYAGFVLLGFLGMLLGPITFMLCRVAVYAVCGTPDERSQAAAGIKPFFPFAGKTKKKLRP
ncbi:MAG: sporulation integral membrane protein YtvI [Oscillospiraceae bacterium]|nr:sporulation integral membrane protein YtvI [Oscillospiraceae bacterium]